MGGEPYAARAMAAWHCAPSPARSCANSGVSRSLSQPTVATTAKACGGSAGLFPAVLPGVIYEVFTYDKALSAAMIGASYGAGTQQPVQGRHTDCACQWILF